MKLDFESNETGTFLVFTMEEEDVLDKTSMGMLGNNRIKGVLPLTFSQMDSRRYIRYNITSKISLSQYFSGVVSMQRLLDVMCSLVETVQEAKEYLMEAASFLWDWDYIFVDAKTGETFLVCIPVEGMLAYAVNLEQFFRHMLSEVRYDPAGGNNCLEKLWGYINSGSEFNMDDFKRVLEEIKKESRADGRVARDVFGSYAVNQQAVGGRQPDFSSPQMSENSGSEKRAEHPGEADNVKKAEVSGSLGQAGNSVVIKIPGGGEMPVAGSGESEKNGWKLFSGRDAKNKPKKKNKETGKGRDTKEKSRLGVSVNDTDDRTETFDNGGFADDKTEVLFGGRAAASYAWLELLNSAVSGLMPRIELNFDRPYLTIGRLSSDEARPDIAFPRELKTIGRQHARIEKREDGIYIIDLGSANHTLLNNEVLRPNQAYQLMDGMELIFTTSRLISYRVHIM